MPMQPAARDSEAILWFAENPIRCENLYQPVCQRQAGKFLYGKNLINQKQEKEIGHPITYYQVIGKSMIGVEYTPIYDYMEEDKGEET